MNLIEQFSSLFGNETVEENGEARMLAYCASNIGLGHYCRLLRVLDEVKKQVPRISILLATDARDTSLAARTGVAVLQLPRFRFQDHEKFKEKPEWLNIRSRELLKIRSTLLLSLGKSYRPHVLLMDTNPHGKRDEVLPLLKYLRRQRRCRTLLMMRDIPAPPGESFKLNGEALSIRRHGHYYDRLLLAGDRQFFDAAQAYGWPEDVRAKMAYLGFVVPSPCTQAPDEAFAHYPQLDPKRRTVVVSFGGGWQAERHAAALIEGLTLYRQHQHEPVQMVMAVGLTLAPELFKTLKERAEALGGVAVEHFSTHFPQLLTHADMAMLQAGSVPFQVLDSNIPILLTHRPYKSREQEERAKRLARWPGIRLVDQESISPQECAEWLAWGLEQPRQRRETGYSFSGIANAAQEVVAALKSIGNGD